MEGISGFWHCATIFMTLLLVFKLIIISRKAASKLPPGPPGWPIVGNLLQLGEKPNESLSRLAAKYGPLMTLHLGMKTTVVVSSPVMAKEVLKSHDQVFSARDVTEAGKCLSYNDSSMVWLDCGPRWRLLRKLCNTELFSVMRSLDALQHLRRDQIFSSIQSIFKDSTKGKGVNIGHTMFLTDLNLFGNMIFSQNMFKRDSEAAEKFNETVAKLIVLNGKPNVVDFFPFLRILDPQGVRRDVTKFMSIVFELIDRSVEDRLQSKKEGRIEQYSGAKAKDFLDILLEYRSESGETLTRKDIISFLYELFLGGSETGSSTTEWAMAEAIHNPRIMKKAQTELDEVIGKDRLVKESDIDRLPYLHALVREVFRLHPAVPLIPRRAESGCEVAGYMIPKDTQMLVNVWTIGRDPSIWKEPLKFKPERFMESELEYRGQNFELIPFGAGRRICPGLPLAHRMAHVSIASLLHCFDWSLPDGITADNMDMTERIGITLRKASPLIAVPSLLISLTISTTSQITSFFFLKGFPLSIYLENVFSFLYLFFYPSSLLYNIIQIQFSKRLPIIYLPRECLFFSLFILLSF